MNATQPRWTQREAIICWLQVERMPLRLLPRSPLRPIGKFLAQVSGAILAPTGGLSCNTEFGCNIGCIRSARELEANKNHVVDIALGSIQLFV